jgi:hypothetical protein
MAVALKEAREAPLHHCRRTVLGLPIGGDGGIPISEEWIILQTMGGFRPELQGDIFRKDTKPGVLRYIQSMNSLKEIKHPLRGINLFELI